MIKLIIKRRKKKDKRKNLDLFTKNMRKYLENKEKARINSRNTGERNRKNCHKYNFKNILKFNN